MDSAPGPWSKLLRTGLGLVSVLVVVGALSIALELAAERIGPSGDTSYNEARSEFTSSWGGKIQVSPSKFIVRWRHTVPEINDILKAWVDVGRVDDTTVRPTDITFADVVTYSHQQVGSLEFSGFEVEHTETSTVTNTTENAAELVLRATRPAGALYLGDFNLRVGDGPPIRPVVDSDQPVIPSLAPGESATVTVHWRTRGVDSLTYRLTELGSQVQPHVGGTITLDTTHYSVLNRGIPNERVDEAGTSTLRYDLRDFLTTGDVGVTFRQDQPDFGATRVIVERSPLPLLLFAAAVLAWRAHSREPLRPMRATFPSIALALYFLLLGYLVRYIPLPASVGVAGLASVGLTLLTVFPGYGRRFALRVVLPYQLLLTLGFTLVSTAPTLRGFLTVVLSALVATSILVPLSRLQDPDAEGGPVRA